MNNQEILNKESEDLYETDEFVKKFKKLTKEQQLSELSRMVAEINEQNS